MQEKKQNISPIKQRILQFATTLGISKRDFYSKIGVSRGTLESKTGITEDVITKFFATYSQISIEWLMTGKGEMIVEKQQLSSHPTSQSAGIENILLDIINAKDATIREMAEEIGQLRERINQMELCQMDMRKDASDVPISGIANAG
jgi:hypothetical protein